MFEHCAAAGVKATVENVVAGEDRAAATVTCEFPGGRKVVANGIFELEDGRIVRERKSCRAIRSSKPTAACAVDARRSPPTDRTGGRNAEGIEGNRFRA